MNGKILVVDDEKSLLKTIDKVLTKEGYVVTATDNGYDAIDKIKIEFFDLIIMDVRMPDMDGISLLKKIREIQEEDNKSMVIILTAYASEDTPINALKLGADDYIMKPFELDNFLRSVRRNVKISCLQNEKREYMQRLEESHEKYKNLASSLTRVIWAKTKDKDLDEKIRGILKKYE